MSNQISLQGSDGVCSFCRRQMNLDPALGTEPRGGLYLPPGDAPAVRLCTSCVATDALAELFAGAVLDSGLDPGTAAAGLAAAVSTLFDLPE